MRAVYKIQIKNFFLNSNALIRIGSQAIAKNLNCKNIKFYEKRIENELCNNETSLAAASATFPAKSKCKKIKIELFNS